MRRSWTPSIVPNGHDQTFYIVINNYGELGPAFAETRSRRSRSRNHHQRPDVRGVQHLRTLVRGCIGGRRAGDALPSSLAAFVESHVGPDRQLTLRLA